MKRLFSVASLFVQELVILSCYIGLALLAVRMIGEMWPLFTIAFVVIGTTIAFKRRITTLMSLGGLALYAISWPIVAWGVFPAVTICFVGILSWFVAILVAVTSLRQIPAEVRR